MDRPDPNELLRHARQALALNNASLLGITFMTLDKHLRSGGALPDAWGGAASAGLREFVTESGIADAEWDLESGVVTDPIEMQGISTKEIL